MSRVYRSFFLLLTILLWHPALFAQDISATLSDSLESDAGADGDVNVGDTLRYQSDIDNDSGAVADGQTMVFDLTLDANTTLVPGSVNVSPLALDDAYAATPDTQLVVSDAGLGLFANDVEFLSDTFSLNTFDATSTEGGTVAVSADGTFTFDPFTGFSGTDTFSYTLVDGGGLVSVPGIVTITINAAPSITTTDAVSVDENQTAVIDINSTDAEDTEGAGLTYSKTGGADQALFSLVAGTGVLTFSAAPDFENPGDDNTDNDYEVQVTVTDSGGLTDVQDITVTVDDVAESPVAAAQAHTAQGNVGISVAAASGLLDGATDDDGVGTLSMLDSQVGANATTEGGTITIADDGSFTYAPPAGFSGSDTFAFTIEDGGGLTDGATATFTVNSDIIWFVDPNDGNDTTGDGTLSAPFASLTPLGAGGSANSLDAANQTIFLFDADGSVITADSGLQLENGQQLIGDGVTGTGTINTLLGFTTQTNSLTLPGIGASPKPTLSTVSADAVQVVTNNTVRGIRIGDSGAGYAISGTNFGTLAIGDMEIAGSGGLLELITGTLSGPGGTGAATFDSMTTTLVTSYGIQLFAVDGSLTVSGATDIDTGPVGIYIHSSPGAAFDFGDTTVDGGIDAGVTIQDCAGTTTTFDSLSITAGSGTGLYASVAGTINIGGTSNTINATGGAALVVGNTTSGGWTFSTLSSTNSSASGINLVDVTGNITASGGSISGATSTDFVVDGGSGNVTYDGSITSTSNYAVGITNRTGGTVDLNGAVTSTGGYGIRLEDNSAGNPVVRFDGNVTINNSTVTAVTVQDNTGATIHFADLDIDNTTSNQIGILASDNTGTLSTAAGTINTGSGMAVVIDNTVLGMTLTSVSTDGASTGIDLTTTTGSFTIAGSGSTVGSGGSIDNSTGHGITLSNVRDVSLNGISIDDTGGHGIFGSGVAAQPSQTNAFSLTNAEILDAGNGNGECAIYFGTPNQNNLANTATITNVVIDNYAENGIEVFNTTNTATVNVSNSAFRNAVGTFVSNGILIDTGTANSANHTLNVSGTVIGRPTGDSIASIIGTGINFIAEGTGIHALSVQETRIENIAFAGSGQAIIASAAQTATLTVDITNNRSASGDGFHDVVGNNVIVSALDNATVTGNVSNNTVSFSGNASNGSAFRFVGDGGAIGTAATFTLTVNASNNTLTGLDAAGIDAVSRDTTSSSGTVSITASGNTITNNGFGLEGISVNSQHSASLCLNASGNTITTGGGFDEFGLLRQDSSTLSISQSSVPALSAANAGGGVFTFGTVTFNTTCSIP